MSASSFDVMVFDAVGEFIPLLHGVGFLAGGSCFLPEELLTEGKYLPRSQDPFFRFISLPLLLIKGRVTRNDRKKRFQSSLVSYHNQRAGFICGFRVIGS